MVSPGGVVAGFENDSSEAVITQAAQGPVSRQGRLGLWLGHDPGWNKQKETPHPVASESTGVQTWRAVSNWTATFSLRRTSPCSSFS